MVQSIASLVPDVADLLALEVEELAGVLLLHLNSDEDTPRRGGAGGFGYGNFFNSPSRNDYDTRQAEVSRALMEAWAWLRNAGLLIEIASQSGGDFFFVSRRGKQIASRADFDAYRKARLLPQNRLHPLIAGKVYPAFMRGEYDTAVFQAFREVEIAVRTKGQYDANDLGVDLTRAAFKPAAKGKNSVQPGPLTDVQLPVAEQEAMSNLFAGAIGLYKNPHSHRHVPTSPEEAADVIIIASQLLRIVSP